MGALLGRRMQDPRNSLLLIALFITSFSLSSFASTIPIRPRAASRSFKHHAHFERRPAGYVDASSASMSTIFPKECHSSSTMQEKRGLTRAYEDHNGAGGRKTMEEDMKRVRALRKRLGSRPPMCRDKCEACFPCEAVKMVPNPTITSTSAMQHVGHLDYSNYDPEGWKCKCGARIFNP